MSSFPEWARPWLASQTRQVSHGLNLVLELDPSPNRLPLLLWDIVVAQDKIKSALESLSFVHFARFIPSWDGRALMVTTEFDGELDPYVLDFVIALGDVFDTLMGYVTDPPTLPVREHPDEFLAWVRKWNRVPFYLRSEATLFPEDFDYPVYSAYADKTVTDILGARTELPLPAIDHPAANVDPLDVQGNILTGYNARHASYLFFSIVNPAAARRWLAQELPDPAASWLGVASAARWTAVPPVLTQVALSHEGLSKLLPPARQADLEAFPKAFKEGAAARADANFDRGESGPDHWMFGGSTTEPVHVVLFLYTKEDPASAHYVTAVRALEAGAAKGLKYLGTQTAKSLGVPEAGYEHFGFRDGLSEPRISGQCPVSAPAFQPSASPGEFLLHKDYKSIYGGSSLGGMPEGLATNGSFGVLRLLEQDTAEFRAATDREAARLKMADADRLRAKLMGRWTEGEPLALVHNKPPAPPPGTLPTPASALNSFDYAPSWEFPGVTKDHEGLHCPVGAHIRRANPRTARVAGQRHGRRLLRRGMPTSWHEEGVDKVGLMGLFLGANIEQQFEFIQRQWLQGDLAASGIRGTTDPIAAIRSEDTDFHFLEPDPAGAHLPPLRLTARIPPLVKTRGCVYLFFPGLKALRALDAAISPVSVAAQVAGIADLGVIGITKAVSKGAGAAGIVVQGVFGAAAKAVSKVSDLLDMPDLPDVDLDQLASDLPALKAWLMQPVLHQLANGQWKEIVDALIHRKLDSPWVKELIDSFSPAPVKVDPSRQVDQGDINLAKRSFLADPYPALMQLREVKKTPIVWVKEQQAYWVLDYAGCKDLLARNADFGQTQSDTPFAGVITLDDPRHQVVRSALDDAFSIALAAINGKIDVTVAQAVERLTDQTHMLQFDFMDEFARPVSRSVIWQLLGIQTAAQRAACDALAHTMVLNFGRDKGPGTVESIVFADAALRLAARVALPLSDAWIRSFLPHSPYEGTLIGELAARVGPGLPLAPPRPLRFIETLMTLVQTVLASQSPHFLLGSAALHLLRPDPRRPASDPLPWKKLATLSSKLDFERALNEARRCEPPLTLIERYAQGPQQICGLTVPDNCPVFAMVASGNRDSVAFGADAEEFHWDRVAATDHLSLGHGIHECAGKFVQDRLVTAALGQLIKAMPDLRLSNPDAVPAWYATIYFRELQALSVARCPP